MRYCTGKPLEGPSTVADAITCTKCKGEIARHEKKIKITVNGEVTFRHDRKCA